MLSKKDLDYIAEYLFDKLVSYQNEMMSTTDYIISDEMGNTRHVTEDEYLRYEIEKLEELQKNYEINEEYELAQQMKIKIFEHKLRLSKL